MRRAAAAAALITMIPTGLLTALPSAPADAASSTTGRTRVVADCQHYRIEPRRLISACGDANEYAVVQHYSFWHRDRAVGRGRLVVNDCTPNCAAGTFRRYPARFVLHHPVATRHGRVFTRVRVTFTRHGHREHSVMFLPRRPVG